MELGCQRQATQFAQLHAEQEALMLAHASLQRGLKGGVLAPHPPARATRHLGNVVRARGERLQHGHERTLIVERMRRGRLRKLRAGSPTAWSKSATSSQPVPTVNSSRFGDCVQTTEPAIFRYKAIIGSSLRARTLPPQKTEAEAARSVLNRMTRLGMPMSQRIA